jgi:hypothetical protein
LAHQYSAGNEDLRVTVRQLRVTLSEHERRALLIQLRELAPATTELEELIQIYSTDLGISVGLAAPPPVVQDAVVVDPSPLDALAAAGGVRENPSLDQVFEPATAPQQAGGVRENAALDDIFSKGGNE